ncbi:hypothetical protein H6F52_16800 [Coleofasciculus sp. FACHB-542]|nr:hypothetical protein [Coleofasciculus sp. FACHB-542]
MRESSQNPPFYSVRVAARMRERDARSRYSGSLFAGMQGGSLPFKRLD